MAQSEPVRLRVYRELVARLTVDERLPAARKLVDEAAKRCSSAASTTALAQWRSELDALDQALQTRRQRQEAEAQDAYVQQLRSATSRRSRRAMRPRVPATRHYSRRPVGPSRGESLQQCGSLSDSWLGVCAAETGSASETKT